MINWIYYPLSDKPTILVERIVGVFEKHGNDVESATHVGLSSDGVLKVGADSLAEIGFLVETGKRHEQKIMVLCFLVRTEDHRKPLRLMPIFRREILLLKSKRGGG